MVGKNVFEGCAVETVTFAGGKSSLTWTPETFYGSQALKEIDFGERGFSKIPMGAFAGKENLETVRISSEVTAIEDGAFADCYQLKEISGCQKVSSIGASAFYGCGKLSAMEFGNSLQSIGSSAFSDCSSLKQVSFPNTLQTIGQEAFLSCISLTQVNLPSKVQGIGVSAFSNCDALKQVYVYGETQIGDSAFADCDVLTMVSLSDSLKSIGSSAFSSCDSLTQIYIPGSMETTGSLAFSGCENLQQVSFNDGFKTIPQGMFYDCNALTTVSFPSSVTSIGSSAFYSCDALETITLPRYLSSIESEAFYGCNSLHEVYDFSQALYIEKDSTMHGYVARNAVAVHDSASDWLRKVQIGDFTFKYSNDGAWALTKYTGSDATVKLAKIYSDAYIAANYEVARYAFEDGNIETIVIGEGVGVDKNGVAKIRSEAFCLYNLHLITFNNSAVKSLPYGSFSSCWNLEEIMIPTQLTSIASGALPGNWINVYYMGTSSQWSSQQYSYMINKNWVYYYDDCAHEGNEWRYDANGDITTQGKEYSQESIIKEATCTENGISRHTCPDCKEYYDISIDKWGHNYTYGNIYNMTGYCTRCAKYNEFAVTKTSFNVAQGALEFTNDTKLPFNMYEANDSSIMVVSNAQATSTLTLTAKSNIKISFTASCSGAQSVLKIVGGGKTHTIKGDALIQSVPTYTFNLTKGQTVTFTYTHTVPENVAAVSGRASIGSLKITSQS